MAAEAQTISVIGGGAAGLAAAIFAAQAAAPEVKVVLLEGAARIGAKILISGGGRCNVTHAAVHPEDFNGKRNIIRNVLAAFDVAATRRWFAELGVALKQEETGKLFPVSDSARSVVDALLRRCRELGVELHTGWRVEDVRADGDRLTVCGSGQSRGAACVIMATGGRSLPQTGSDGGGWEIVRRLGHSVTPTYPALVPLVLAEDCFHRQLSGVSHNVELSVFAGGKLQDRRAGSLLWTHFGISGPVVMDASRHWVIARAEQGGVELRCNFFPGESFEAVESWLTSSAAATPRLSLGRLLGARLPERVGLALLAHSGVGADTQLAQLPRPQRRQLVHRLSAFALPVTGARGWNFAEVTAGGVPLEEVDYRSMASRRVAGLYLIGEMLDCDGRIGGFNFQWAWATGYLAGRAAAARLAQR